MPDDVIVRRNLSRVVIGLSIIAAGILFTLDNLRIAQAETYLSYWPLVIVLIGVVQIVQGRTWGGYFWGLMLIVAGAWLLGENLGIVSVSIWTLSPLLLVLLGASIIWRGCCPPVLARGSMPDGAAFIRGTAVLGGFDRTSDATDFRGGDIVVVMGGCKLDLRRATIAANEAVIDVLAIMGGVEIRIPETWTVDAKVLPLMGGVTNQTHVAGSGTAQRLVVRGTVFMGGVELKN
jgi:predicted membrane protein